MHDTLAYFGFDPIHRNFHHGKLTFGLMYAYSERFLLPLSHDEVVHLKKSLVSKMPGDRWKMHATLRSLYGYMWAHPGKKLLFMGGEIAQWGEWNFETELDWSLLGEADHAGMHRLVRDINALYKKHAALYELDDDPVGFRWIDANDAPQSVASFLRFPAQPRATQTMVAESKAALSQSTKPQGTKGVHVVFVGNFTPMPRHGYRVGVPRRCRYLEVLNTDAKEYGGSGMGNYGSAAVEAIPSHGFDQSIVLTLPPLAALWLVPELDEDPDAAEDEAATSLDPAVAKLAAAPVARAATDEDKAVSTERNTGSMPPRRRR
jgi:1,4-alpha-glucan branching enzyme